MTGTAHLDSGPYEDLQRFSEQVAALESALHAQRDMLRQRGWEISEHISDRLLAIRDGLARAATRLGDETTEAFQLRALAETIALLNSSLDVDRVFTEVIDTVLALTGAERGYIVLRDSQTGELRFRVARMHGKTISRRQISP